MRQMDQLSVRLEAGLVNWGRARNRGVWTAADERREVSLAGGTALFLGRAVARRRLPMGAATLSIGSRRTGRQVADRDGQVARATPPENTAWAGFGVFYFINGRLRAMLRDCVALKVKTTCKLLPSV